MNLYKNNYFQSEEFKKLNLKIFNYQICDINNKNFFIYRNNFNKKKIKITKKEIGSEFKGILEIFGQPIDIDPKNYNNQLSTLLDKTNEIIKSLNPGIVIFRNFDLPNKELYEMTKNIFHSYGYGYRPWETIFVDLDRTNKNKRIKNYNTRREIKLIKEKNPTIKKVENFEDYKKYLDYFFNSEGHSNYPNKMKFYNLIAWQNLKINQEFFIIKLNNTPHALFSARTYKTRAYWTMVGRIIKYKYSLHAYAINFLCEYLSIKKIKFLDLAGYNPSPSNQKERGIKFFKEKFAGKIIHQPTFIYDNTSLVKSLRSRVNYFKNKKTLPDESIF